MSLSIIIPTLKIEFLQPLFDSMQNFDDINSTYEIIIINQSDKKVQDHINTYNLNYNDVLVNTKLSAPQARNFGANFSKYDYLFFLDDDCILYELNTCHLNQLFYEIINYDFIYFDRGVLNNKQFLSHHNFKKNINDYNFNKYIIEWNFIIKKDLFFKINCFENIGPGSLHCAHSGEAFNLFFKMKKVTNKIKCLSYVKIAHPDLIINVQDNKKNLKYNYGSGYSIGISLKFMNILTKIFWICRLHGSFLKNKKFYFNRIFGFYDAIFFKNPRHCN